MSKREKERQAKRRKENRSRKRLRFCWDKGAVSLERM